MAMSAAEFFLVGTALAVITGVLAGVVLGRRPVPRPLVVRTANQVLPSRRR
jgi:hypothetical protein